MGLFNRIFAGQKIDEWASDYTLVAARTLNQVAADLIVSAEDEIAKVGLKDGLFSQATFIQERIAPMVRSVAEPVAIEISTRRTRLSLNWLRSRPFGCGGQSMRRNRKVPSRGQGMSRRPRFRWLRGWLPLLPFHSQP